MEGRFHRRLTGWARQPAILGVAGIAVAWLLVGWTPEPTAAVPKANPAIGDGCLVGTWVGTNESAPGNWTWNGELIAVSGLAGMLVTFKPDGIERLDLSHAAPLVADYHGHQIKIVIRGAVDFRVHADGHAFDQVALGGNPSVRFYYDGALQSGGSVSFAPVVNSYVCTARTLRLEAPAFHAGYGPQVDLLSRSGPAGAGDGSLVSSVAGTLATPADVFHAPLTLLASALLALALVLFVTFPSHLFNRTFEENHDAIRDWWERRVPWLHRLRSRAAREPNAVRAGTGFAVVALVGGLLASLLDPRFGLNLRTLALFAGAVLALTAGTAVSAAAAGVYRLVTHTLSPWRLQALPSALIIATLCVLVSRLTAFQPGYLYGVIGGVVFARTLGRREEGHVVAVTSLTTLALSVGAWLLWVPVTAAAQAAPSAFGWALLSNFLAAVFVSGIVGLLIGLVPLRFLPGEKLARWHQGVWGAVFGFVGVAMIEVMLRPESSGVRVATAPVLTTLALFAGFGLASVLFWGYFRRRKRPVAAAPETP